MKKWISVLCITAMLLSVFCSCGSDAGKDDGINPNLDTSKEVTLRVAGAWEDFPAMELLAGMFSEKYPNCKVVYEYVQNYEESLLTRFNSSDAQIDLFLSSGIQNAESSYYPFALELLSQADKLDLSGTFPGLIDNSLFKDTDASAAKQLYSIPMGAELRGMYVNKTLLKTMNLEVPTNLTEFMNACKVIKDNGYIPLQGNPGRFGQTLLYPYICCMIANSPDYETLYNNINEKVAGVEEYFREPMKLMYDLTANYYYDYKTVENDYGMFKDSSDEGVSRDFLNIVDQDGTFVKLDDIGRVAFMPYTNSMGVNLEKMSEDYHSGIEYEFILSPLSENGGYAYLSPAHNIAVYKDSPVVDWALEFLDFMFEPENNIKFTQAHNISPNTATAFELLKEQYNIPEENITHLGTMTFKYGFYQIISSQLVSISKCNNPKYMIDNGDGTYTLHEFEYYMEALKTAFSEG